jgi:hypothetical protein
MVLFSVASDFMASKGMSLSRDIMTIALWFKIYTIKHRKIMSLVRDAMTERDIL